MSQSVVTSLYGGPVTRRVRTRDLLDAKERGEKWPMLTSYDQYTAGIFDASGIPALLVRDCAANNVYGYETTVPVAVDELLPLARAVVRGAFAVVLEKVPGEVAMRVTHDIAIPTIGIGAGLDTDAQVLVWQDMAGLRTGKAPRFVKRYADLAGALSEATQRFAAEVRGSEF